MFITRVVIRNYRCLKSRPAGLKMVREGLLFDRSPGAHRDELRKSLDKLLVETAIALPFEHTQRLSPSTKDELEILIRDTFVAKDLTRLATKWEPQRKLDAELKDTLREDLIDLLHGSRRLFTAPIAVDLAQARTSVKDLGPYISRSLPTTEAKKLLKRWDKKLKPMPKSRAEIIRHLLKLLDESHKQRTSHIA